MNAEREHIQRVRRYLVARSNFEPRDPAGRIDVANDAPLYEDDLLAVLDAADYLVSYGTPITPTASEQSS